MSQNDAGIIGTWKLLSFNIEFKESLKQELPYGETPNGYLLFLPEGRMMAVITAKERQSGTTESLQAALFRTLMAYTGRYRIEGDRFITKVDASWNEAWNGSEQERSYKIDGHRLDIVSAWQPHPKMANAPVCRGILSWERSV